MATFTANSEPYVITQTAAGQTTFFNSMWFIALHEELIIEAGATVIMDIDFVSDPLNITGNISGAGTLIKRNLANLILSGDNRQFTGDLDISFQAVTIRSQNSLPAGNILLNGGSLVFNNGIATNLGGTNPINPREDIIVNNTIQVLQHSFVSNASMGGYSLDVNPGVVYFDGPITGSHELSFGGQNRVTIDGINYDDRTLNRIVINETKAHTGQWTIRERCSLLLTGNHNNTDIVVQGDLRGNATVRDIIVNDGGRLQPGWAIGERMQCRDLTMRPGSQLWISYRYDANSSNTNNIENDSIRCDIVNIGQDTDNNYAPNTVRLIAQPFDFGTMEIEDIDFRIIDLTTPGNNFGRYGTGTSANSFNIRPYVNSNTDRFVANSPITGSQVQAYSVSINFGRLDFHIAEA